MAVERAEWQASVAIWVRREVVRGCELLVIALFGCLRDFVRIGVGGWAYEG